MMKINKLSKMSTKRYGFTVLELIIVICICGIFLGLLLPGVMAAIGASNKLSCANNLRQIGISLVSFHDSFGSYPCGNKGKNVKVINPPLYSWFVSLLPWLEQDELFKLSLIAVKIEPNNYYSNPPHVGNNAIIKQFICSSDGRITKNILNNDGHLAAYTSYIGIAGGSKFDGVLGNVPGIKNSDIFDGSSNTIFIGERPPPSTYQAGKWYSSFLYQNGIYGHTYGPDETIFTQCDAVYMGDQCQGPFSFGPGSLDNPCDRYHLWSLHRKGGQFGFCDGSVKFINYNYKNGIVNLSTRAGGEPILPYD